MHYVLGCKLRPICTRCTSDVLSWLPSCPIVLSQVCVLQRGRNIGTRAFSFATQTLWNNNILPSEDYLFNIALFFFVLLQNCLCNINTVYLSFITHVDLVNLSCHNIALHAPELPECEGVVTTFKWLVYRIIFHPILHDYKFLVFPALLATEVSATVKHHVAPLKHCISVLFMFQRKPAKDDLFVRDLQQWITRLVSDGTRLPTLLSLEKFVGLSVEGTGVQTHLLPFRNLGNFIHPTLPCVFRKRH